jgi:ribosomal-protein-alanine N-acetyltransferase
VKCETRRLRIEPFTLADAPFMLRLMNEPSYIENIADRGIRSVADAQDYLREGPLASYQQHGFGLWRVSLRSSSIAVGMCGLLKRDFLELVDIGYAFLPEHCGRGYAREAAKAVLQFAGGHLALQQVAAIVNEDNAPSVKLLSRLGFRHRRVIRMPEDGAPVQLYTRYLETAADR